MSGFTTPAEGCSLTEMRRAPNWPGKYHDHTSSGTRVGLRIDHLLLSPAVAPRLAAAGTDRDARAWEKSSDHVPTWIEIRDADR